MKAIKRYFNQYFEFTYIRKGAIKERYKKYGLRDTIKVTAQAVWKMIKIDIFCNALGLIMCVISILTWPFWFLHEITSA